MKKIISCIIILLMLSSCGLFSNASKEAEEYYKEQHLDSLNLDSLINSLSIDLYYTVDTVEINKIVDSLINELN